MFSQARHSIFRRIRRWPMLRALETRRRFQIERDLLNGRTHRIIAHPSILHFSINKAATQYTRRILLRCGRENGLLPVQMSAYAWNANFPYLFTLSAEEVKPYLHIFHPQGYLYTVFGGLVEGIPNLDRYHTVIMVRDPRDVLVSGFYSYAYSHVAPPSEEKVEEFVEWRTFVQNLTLDEYAIEISHNVRERLQKYLTVTAVYPQTCVLKYEQMIADFPSWLDCLLSYCQLTISPGLRRELIDEADRTSHKKKEEISAHRRQVTPGEHQQKLKPETIDYLNTYLADVLTGFGYVTPVPFGTVGSDEQAAIH
jgi:hypothetical protein